MAYTPRQILVNPPRDRMTGGIGKSNIAALQNAYPGAPNYAPNDLTDDAVISQYKNVVNVGEPVAGRVAGDDGGHTFGIVDLDYREAPDLTTVEIGGAGLPGSPYAPNIASPPEGQNPADIPESGVAATDLAKGSGAPFSGDGLANPKDTSLVISTQTLGSLRKGSSTPTG